MKPHEARSLKEIVKCCNGGAKPKFIFFWGHTPPKSGEINKACFRQWYNAPFKIDNVVYPTTEHYMMASKARLFRDQEAFDKIIFASSPGAAKAFGREVKNFDEKKWIENRFKIVSKGNFEKFNQNPNLRNFLLNTKNRVLVEASPKDTIWGIGMAESDEGADQPVKWRGLNILGFALMEAREQILLSSN